MRVMLSDRFELWVPGKAIPQGSMKGYVRAGKTGAPVAGITNSNPLLIQWRMKVTGHAIEQQAEYLHTRPALTFPIEGPIGVKVEFIVERTQDHFLPVNKKRTEPALRPDAPHYPAKAPDIDKLVRAIFDALTDARVWKDDGQVVWVQSTKTYGEQPGVHITLGAMR